MTRNIIILLFSFLVFTFFSCAEENEKEWQAQFPVTGTNAALFTADSEAKEGKLNFSSSGILEYYFDDSFFLSPNSSFRIEYEITCPDDQAAGENCLLALKLGETSCELPIYEDTVCFYTMPVDSSFNGHFGVIFTSDTGTVTDKNSSPVFKIRSIGFTEMFIGFSDNGNRVINSCPFVDIRDSGYSINIPESVYSSPLLMDIEASFLPEGAKLEFDNTVIEILPGVDSLYFPSAMYQPERDVTLTGEGIMSFVMNPSEVPEFPVPVKADPALIVEWPQRNWRNPNYEIFRWDRFPSILIFDFADYNIQDRMLKRLAFFVEKTGFRGRLAHDSEISHLHGWNAHDYRAEDLAWFFDTVRSSGFPLLKEELELERILLNEGIITETLSGIAPGRGAIISISRESPDYLRWRFMAHEGFHGLFFIDEEFREFTRQRWEQLHITAKRFLLSFFGYQQYDIGDEYLLLNEFMAHVLQQSVPNAAYYFGSQLPSTLADTWRASDLPQRDEETGTWPFLAEAFTAEARSFTGYVNNRWGIAAGRVWTLNIRRN